MTISRLPAAISLLVAPVATLAAQLILVGMPAADTALERIRLAPEAWTSAHVLLAIAAAAWVLAGVALLEKTVASMAAFVLLLVGVVIAATINGVDAVLGVLSGINADGGIHRAIAENLLQPLDLWDSALTIGLVALVALVHTRGTLPWWGPAAALIGLAVPAFSDLRVVAAAAVLAGFAVLAASLLAESRTKAPFWVSIVIVLAFVPAAVVSAERAIVLAVAILIVAIGWLRLPPRQPKDRKVTAL